ncbi:class A beta-lactamase [Candidatus Fukatsuia symbiotica]|uniref:class A beta-lactamase n=1 Tax=Candidatus Fukatsuia TaxID=1927833 RepID=UPI00093528D5|nr:class A beta-lactamase [Candidatus Fukatsuia symbiotica]MEA9446007.1 class A beta-lactamase [Candidatus Fukatsuia symbiotica]
MIHSLLRRSLFLATIIVLFVGVCPLLFAGNQGVNLASIQEKLSELEKISGGRLGLFAINTANNLTVQYRAVERFPVTSTFKVLAVAAILKQSVTDRQLLQQRITYNPKDLVSYSPITEKHLGMTVEELCAATIQYSDNTAVNLLMKLLGGPKAVTEFARSIGDHTFRLDRWETDLNSAIPGDLRDTSTPVAMAKSVQRLVLGDALPPAQREKLQVWLKGNTTGDASIRAGIPEGWVVGDKTGGGDYGTTNDIGVLWPPTAAPIVVAIYFTQNEKDAQTRKDVIASATRILISAFD